LKASSATFVKSTTVPCPTGRSSDRPPPTPTRVEGAALIGPSALPDPAFHAYRKDLADVALATQVIASHYAEPVARTVIDATALREAASDQSETIRQLEPGAPFLMLDDTLGWAWGYAGNERRVGYVRSEALGT
jgi:hypothetical protein